MSKQMYELIGNATEKEKENARNRFLEGKYIVKIEDVYLRENKSGLKVGVIDCIILKSEVPSIETGALISWVTRLENSTRGPKDFRKQLSAICGASIPNFMDASMVEYLLTPNNIPGYEEKKSLLNGNICNVIAYRVTTEKGKSYIKVDFEMNPFLWAEDSKLNKIVTYKEFLQKNNTTNK